MIKSKKDSVIRVRLEDDLPDWVRREAEADHRSINSFFNKALHDYRKMKQQETNRANHA